MGRVGLGWVKSGWAGLEIRSPEKRFCSSLQRGSLRVLGRVHRAGSEVCEEAEPKGSSFLEKGVTAVGLAHWWRTMFWKNEWKVLLGAQMEWVGCGNWTMPNQNKDLVGNFW